MSWNDADSCIPVISEIEYQKKIETRENRKFSPSFSVQNLFDIIRDIIDLI